MAIFDKIKGAYLKNKKKRKAYSEYLDRLEKAQGGDKQAQYELDKKQRLATSKRSRSKYKPRVKARRDLEKAKKTYKSSMPSVDKPVTPEYYKAKEGLSKADKAHTKSKKDQLDARNVSGTTEVAFMKKYKGGYAPGKYPSKWVGYEDGKKGWVVPRKSKTEPQRGVFEGVEERDPKTGNWRKKPEVKVAPKKKKKKRFGRIRKFAKSGLPKGYISSQLKTYGKRFLDYQTQGNK